MGFGVYPAWRYIGLLIRRDNVFAVSYVLGPYYSPLHWYLYKPLQVVVPKTIKFALLLIFSLNIIFTNFFRTIGPSICRLITLDILVS